MKQDPQECAHWTQAGEKKSVRPVACSFAVSGGQSASTRSGTGERDRGQCHHSIQTSFPSCRQVPKRSVSDPHSDRNLGERLGVLDASKTPGYKVPPGMFQTDVFSRASRVSGTSLGKAGLLGSWATPLHHRTRPPVEGKGQQEQEDIWEPRLLGHRVRSQPPALAF